MPDLSMLTENLGYGKTEEYTSNFNFEEFEINDKDKFQLAQKEQKLINAQNQVVRNLFDIAKNLYEAQQILSNYRNGGFKEWFTSLGFNKDYVYRMIDKYNLSIETGNRKAIDLPVRVVKELKNSDFDIETKISVLNSEQPLITVQKLKEEQITIGKTAEELIKEKIEYHQEMKRKYKRLMKLQDEEIIRLQEELKKL